MNSRTDNNLFSILSYVENTEGSAFFFTPPQCDANAASYLFMPETGDTVISAETKKDLCDTLKLLDEKGSRCGWGYFTYEAGEIIACISSTKKISPLAIFRLGRKDQIHTYISESLVHNIIPPEPLYTISNARLNIDEDRYAQNIAQIRNLISLGETYQINFTSRLNFDFSGSPASLFLNLIFMQSAPYAAFINDGGRCIISLSPELFFETDGSTITCRPMKGTTARGRTLEEDSVCAEQLRTSIKNRAENVMIVDLICNDIHALAPETVAETVSLFDIERYETVLQMTSTVRSILPGYTTLSDIISKLFPCGSITGAPKLRSMEIIARIEDSPRSIYTGAIGLLLPHKSVFSVPIRTAVIDNCGSGELGIGGGIVWDSSAQEEYSEMRQKGSFLFGVQKPFYLFETMLIEKGNPFLLEYHLQRLKQSAEYFLFQFDDEKIDHALAAAMEKADSSENYRLKLMLYKWGAVQTEISSFNDVENAPVEIIISDAQVSSKDAFLYHKTSRRDMYALERGSAVKKGFFESIFCNELNHITEGTITNIFCLIDGTWYTPPVSDGLLAGCYRRFFLEKNNAAEKSLTADDLRRAEKVILTNALRKEIPVKKIVYISYEKIFENP